MLRRRRGINVINNKVSVYEYKPVAFTFHASPGSDVRVAGSFNNWNTEIHKMIDWDGRGAYHIFLMLPKGKHEYKYTVNRQWQTDQRCHQASNGLGTSNNVLEVD